MVEKKFVSASCPAIPETTDQRTDPSEVGYQLHPASEALISRPMPLPKGTIRPWKSEDVIEIVITR